MDIALKFDKQRTKQQLFHISIALGAIFLCMTYIQYHRNYTLLGSLRGSLIVPIIFAGELLKVALARHYSRKDENIFAQKQRQKKSTIREQLGGLLVQTICTILYAFICIILGAPVLNQYEQTFVLALLLTMVTISPTVLLLGGAGALQVCFCEKPDFITKGEETALQLFKYNAVGGILGAWAGSVVAPLDWDRDWQVYPIPNIVGCLLGSILCNMFICSRILYNTAKVYLNKKRS